ncbi:MAG TPA: 3-isopropylmalate dehydratase [Chthoniobacterales bacterium]
MPTAITSPVYVLGDNIDTDQIIPAHFLTLVPTIPDEYNLLGSHAMAGLPDELYPVPFIQEGTVKTPYRLIVAGKNFGCGSSREHAPIALGAAGTKAVIAESYARIFFRNAVATGELYPFEARERLIDVIKTGDVATLNFDQDTLTFGDRTFSLKPMGDVRPVVDAGGLFNYARKTGMIAAREN